MKGLVGKEAACGEDTPSCPDADAGQCRESVHKEEELCEWRYCSGQAANHSAAHRLHLRGRDLTVVKIHGVSFPVVSLQPHVLPLSSSCSSSHVSK